MERKDYRYLQDKIDELMHLMGGSENLISFIEEIITHKDFKEQVSSFITLSVSQHFEITIDDIKAEEKSNSSARTICYYLHHRDFLEGMSIRRIAFIYNRKENAVWRGLGRMDEVIKDPKSDMGLYNSYLHIKSQVQKFVQFIEHSKEVKSK